MSRQWLNQRGGDAASPVFSIFDSRSPSTGFWPAGCHCRGARVCSFFSPACVREKLPMHIQPATRVRVVRALTPSALFNAAHDICCFRLRFRELFRFRSSDRPRQCYSCPASGTRGSPRVPKLSRPFHRAMESRRPRCGLAQRRAAMRRIRRVDRRNHPRRGRRGSSGGLVIGRGAFGGAAHCWSWPR